MKSGAAPARLVILGIVSVSGLTAQPAVHRGSDILRGFSERIDKYAKLHQKLEKKLSKLRPTTSAAVIDDHEKALAAKIREERRKARQGDIFTVNAAQEFRRIIEMAMQAPGTHVEQSLKSAEPVTLPLRVNEAYPTGVPLQSTPPVLLQNLPKLRPEVEYRIVGRSLVLRDTTANLIVDFIPDILPAAAARRP